MKDEPLENNIISLHSRGWSIRQLSLEFAISRERVRRILQDNDRKRRGEAIVALKHSNGSKLDTYKQRIGEILEKYKVPPITNRRVFELIKASGYEGGKTIVGDYLASVRGKKVNDPVKCVETAPGQRGSHDWSEYYLPLTKTGKKEKITFFSFILNYSRRQYICVVDDKSQTTLLDCLINTFVYFGGVPKEVKSDNQKACVDMWDQGRPVFNKRYLEFASHYRFHPLAIHPGKPRENL